MTLYLLHYNNYYNRKVKKENNLEDYLQYLIDQPLENINFVPGDYINTTQIINWYGEHPDYLIAVDENNEINSRWFVISTERIRNGQLQLTLRRDLVVDYYDNITNSPCFIEKAILPSNNNLIFNNENMSFNQIKTSETLLKDESECPWIVIYAASKDASGAPTLYSDTFGDTFPVSQIYNSVDDWNNSDIMKVANGELITKGIDNISILFPTRSWNVSSGSKYYKHTIFEYSAITTDVTFTEPSSNYLQTDKSNNGIVSAFQSNWQSIKEGMTTMIDGYSEINFDNLSKYNNQFVAVIQSDGSYKYYKIQIGYTSVSVSDVTAVGTLKQTYDNIMSTLGTVSGGTTRPLSNYTYLKRTVSIQDVTSSTNTYKFNITNNRYHLIDAPYDMFVMPFSDKLIIKNSSKSGFTTITSNKDLNLKVARALIEKYAGAGQVYDAQIVPYCPLASTVISKSGNNITMDLLNSSDLMYTPITLQNASNVKGYILHATLSSFTRTLNLSNPISIKNYKIESECDMYRICSPNYNGIFEFNAAKNDGISSINISCTYKPYTPYIKVYPDFKRLYGNDYNDARGLICGGDFSLPMTTSAWSTYELQNKNYQNSFTRQIENMEINNAVQKEQDIWNIATGTISGITGGSLSGSMLSGGNPIGAGIGAVVGGVSSLAGGIRDYQLNETLRKESIDYTKDQFGYQLGNIKALPMSLSKTTAYNIDNKYFPFLEYYTCSDEEKKALANKIAYNGMTVMTIGKIEDYINNTWNYGDISSQGYIKGKIIKIENIDEDYHIINAIADEINKGVFI